MQKIINRIYGNFLMPSRISEFSRIINLSLEQGYLHLTLSEYYDQFIKVNNEVNRPVFLHRHDIDTDPATADLFFKAEKLAGIKATYYFRRSTLDTSLMRKIYEYGSEVGYHFEELSDYCKWKNLHKKEELPGHYDAIRSLFIKNFQAIEKQLGFKIKSIASHGDFVNRQLGIPNYAFLNDDLLNSLGITFECYHSKLINSYSFIASDLGYPEFYRPLPPFKAIEERLPVVYLLTHPRHWKASISANLKEDFKRLKEGLLFH